MALCPQVYAGLKCWVMMHKVPLKLMTVAVKNECFCTGHKAFAKEIICLLLQLMDQHHRLESCPSSCWCLVKCHDFIQILLWTELSVATVCMWIKSALKHSLLKCQREFDFFAKFRLKVIICIGSEILLNWVYWLDLSLGCWVNFVLFAWKHWAWFVLDEGNVSIKSRANLILIWWLVKSQRWYCTIFLWTEMSVVTVSIWIKSDPNYCLLK